MRMVLRIGPPSYTINQVKQKLHLVGYLLIRYDNGCLHSQEMTDRLFNPKVPCYVYKRLLPFPVLSQEYSVPKPSRSLS